MTTGLQPAAASRRKRPTPHEQRILLLALAAGAPAIVALEILLWSGDYSLRLRWTLTLLAGGLWLACAFAARERVVYSLRTLANLLAALREGDFSLRGRSRGDDALAEVTAEVNLMSEMLQEQRLGAIEAATLLRRVMDEIDVVVFTFDPQQRLHLVNRAGERLLGQPAERVKGRSAAELGLAECLTGEEGRALDLAFPGGAGRWGIRRGRFFEHGKPHTLLVLSDLTRELREEELKAWQRLVRVIGHELNNSLAPIQSIAASLVARLDRAPDEDWRGDMEQGLAVIGSRAETLSRFMGDYARLAKMPEPQPAPVRVREWVRRVAGLETRREVEVLEGPDVTISADGDQLEQLLINLVRNAADAALETGGGVRAGWHVNGSRLEVWVEDDGPGLSSRANLFVPFFSTKPGGSGIGLVLCRKIAENHHGTVTLENRETEAGGAVPGCVARLRLPIVGMAERRPA